MIATGKVSLFLAALLLALSIYVHFSIGFWGDQDWELLVAQMLLNGKKLYLDHVPVSPPLIFYLYTIPAALAFYVGHLQDYQYLVLLSLLGITLAITLSTRLIALHPGFAGNRNMQAQFVVLLCFLFIFRIASPFFGDREHIFLVLTFPYLLRWMPSLGSANLPSRMKILIGCLAGIGFCIKPHCLLFFAGIQLICLLRKNRLRILGSYENRVIYGIGILYLVLTGIFTPGYFSLVLPMSALTYSAITGGAGGMFDFTIAITVVLTFIMFQPRYTSPYRKDIYYFLGASLFLLAYGMVNNGWGYTYQPVITLLLFTNGFVLWEFCFLRKQQLANGARVWQFSLGIGACWLNFISKAAIVLAYFFVVLSHDCHGDKTCPGYYTKYVDEVKTSGAHSFGMIGMDFALWSHVSKLSGAQWVTRFPQLWMIPRFITADKEFWSNHQWILYYVAGSLADDLERNKPDIVFVDNSDVIYTIKLRMPFDWIALLSHLQYFGEVWQHYRFVHTVDNCDNVEPSLQAGYAMSRRLPGPQTNCRFDVYRRIP